MTHLLRNVVALGCFAGFAAVNGCTSQAGPQGNDPPQEAVDTPVGEAQEEATTAPGGCNITAAPAVDRPGTCAHTVCSLLGNTACCTRSWSGECVRNALSFCRSPTFGGPLSCSCTHPECSTGAALDYGCPGFASPTRTCPMRVCDASSSCCTSTWGSGCVTLARQLCGCGLGGRAEGVDADGDGDGTGDSDGDGDGPRR